MHALDNKSQETQNKVQENLYEICKEVKYFGEMLFNMIFSNNLLLFVMKGHLLILHCHNTGICKLFFSRTGIYQEAYCKRVDY